MALAVGSSAKSTPVAKTTPTRWIGFRGGRANARLRFDRSIAGSSRSRQAVRVERAQCRSLPVRVGSAASQQ